MKNSKAPTLITSHHKLKLFDINQQASKSNSSAFRESNLRCRTSSILEEDW